MVNPLRKIVVLTALMMVIGTALVAGNTSSAASNTGSTASATGNPASITGPQLLNQVQAAVAKLNTFHGTISVDVSSPALKGDASFTAEVWASKPNLGRIEVKSLTAPSGTDSSAEKHMPNLAGATIVFDGSKAWAYVPSENHVYVATPDQQKISQMPTQALTQLQTRLGDLLAQSDVKVIGDEQVNGRDTTKYEITLKPGATLPAGDAKHSGMKGAAVQMLLSNSKLTLWIDKAVNLPVQAEFDTPMGKATFTTSGDEFNQPIPASKFTFTPPTGATVTTVDTSKAEQHSSTEGGKSNNTGTNK